MVTSSNPRDVVHWSEAASSSAASPHSWLMSAAQLRRAADVLRDQWMRDLRDMVKNANPFAVFLGQKAPWQMPALVTPSMMMLLALSLENLAKGLTVVRNPHVAPFGPAPGSKLQRPYHSHFIIDLLTKKPGSGTDVGAGVKLSPAERAQVERLERFLLWGGRYPVPVDPMQMHYSLPDGAPVSVSTDDLVVIDPLLERVRSDLEAEAVKWSAAQAAAAEAEETQRWTAALAALAAFPTQENDGVTVYVDASAADEPGHHSICGCQKSFTVNGRYPGALCPCGNLHYFEPYWDPTIQQERPNARILRAQTRPT